MLLKMNYLLFDGPSRNALLPFTFTRPVAEIRIGILTIREKWELHLSSTITTITEDYLSEKFPMVKMEHNIMICASYLPNEKLVSLILNLKPNQAIYHNADLIAFYSTENQIDINFETFEIVQFVEKIITVKNTWDIFANNDVALREDFEFLPI